MRPAARALLCVTAVAVILGYVPNTPAPHTHTIQPPDDDHPPRSAPQPHTHTYSHSVNNRLNSIIIVTHTQHTTAKHASMQSTHIHTSPGHVFYVGVGALCPRLSLLVLHPVHSSSGSSLTKWLIGLGLKPEAKREASREASRESSRESSRELNKEASRESSREFSRESSREASSR